MCSDRLRPRLLVVSQTPLQSESWQPCELLNLRFFFTSAQPPGDFLAWPKDAEKPDAMELDSGQGYWVSDQCRQPDGGFRQQVLNRFVARSLLAGKVDALLVVGLHGCSLDLPRMAALMGVPAIWMLGEEDLARLQTLNTQALRCFTDSVSRCILVAAPGPLAGAKELVSPGELPQRVLARLQSSPLEKRFDYSVYEFSQRDHPLLSLMQQGDVRHFHGCSSVLDIACGVGIFLDLLRGEGIPARGVERDPAVADYGRGMGLDIATADVFEYLRNCQERYDGIYCSHFVEHLPFGQVQELIELLSEQLKPGGVLVLVFPDPESIRSQLLGFWRDPEHVRFYHPDLILSVASASGLDLDWHSYQDQPHRVFPFSPEPSPVDELSIASKREPGIFGRLLARVGLASAQSVGQLHNQLKALLLQQHKVNQQLTRRTETLWQVNHTWAWNDNAVLKLRKSGEPQ